MTEKDLYHIVDDYSQMSVDSLIELKNLVEDYPYCQTAQILYLLNLKRLGEDTFDTRLPYTAICVHNRLLLKREVEKVEEILMRGARSFREPQRPVAEALEATALRTNNQKSKIKNQNFHNKTISELLNLKKSNPEPAKHTPQTHDDKLLEQLRLEALAKVNDRLNEVRKTMTVHANVTEIPNRMAAAQDIIDKVIATNPKISKVEDSDAKTNQFSHWKFKEEHSLREDFEMVSETLAQLYIAQGAPAKAREIYKTLSKTHPEKAEHFTQLSKQIKSTNTKTKTKK
jgi:tetratricopeptide (TPR) repeat protein